VMRNYTVFQAAQNGLPCFLHTLTLSTVFSIIIHTSALVTECFTSGEYTRHSQIILVGSEYSAANIRFSILVVNASIDLAPQQILKYSSEAIRLIYAPSKP
jgi:hypothetical protein